MTKRRGFLALGGMGLLSLAGCGFQPLYGSQGAIQGARDPQVADELAATRVALITERSGQLLRRNLEQRLGAGGSASPRNELRTSLQFSAEPEGFRRDGTATRVRYSATASWFLVTLAVPPVTLASGVERAFDAFNVPDNQFFAADFSRDATLNRLLEQLADDVVLRMSIALRQRTAQS
jgi:LPS-assembly lipoprotein